MAFQKLHACQGDREIPLGRHGTTLYSCSRCRTASRFSSIPSRLRWKDHPEHLRDDCFRAAAENEIKNKFMKRSIQTIVYLPNFLSWVILATVVVNIFSYEGPINAVLEMLGIEPILFMASNKWFRSVLIVTDVWKASDMGPSFTWRPYRNRPGIVGEAAPSMAPTGSSGYGISLCPESCLR